MAAPASLRPEQGTANPPRPKCWIPLSLRLFVAMMALLFVGGLLWVYTSATWVIWDGRFQLMVNVSGSTGPLESVKCRALADKVQAESVANDPSLYDKLYLSTLWSDAASPFTGSPLQVNVPVSGRNSMSGRELRRSQFHYLVVIGRLQDGRSVGKVIEIPDGRISREVNVSLP